MKPKSPRWPVACRLVLYNVPRHAIYLHGRIQYNKEKDGRIVSSSRCDRPISFPLTMLMFNSFSSVVKHSLKHRPTLLLETVRLKLPT